MTILHLEFPNESHRSGYDDMMQEWRSMEKTPTSPGTLFVEGGFDEFFRNIQSHASQKEKISPQGYAPAHFFFLVEDTTRRVLGAIQVRHHIDTALLKEVGWHIGYGVRPTERWRGYATEMLHLALMEAKKLGLDRVLITCKTDNIASAHVIKANGGVFERYGEKDGVAVCRYWIDIPKED